MKRNIKIRLALLVSALIYTSISIAQGEKPQNIYRVTVNSRYVIEDGVRTSKFFAIGQLISDSLGRMHTEIDYNWETRYPDNYRWHYFDGMNRVRTDFFVKEKLSNYKVYKYNDNNQLAELELYKVNNGDTMLLVKEVYVYSKGIRTSTLGYNQKGKRGFKTKYKYDSHGNEMERRVKGKRAIPSDSIINLKRVTEYDSLGRVLNELVVTKKVSSPQISVKSSYNYDDKGNLVEEIINDQTKGTTLRKEYVYRRDSRIQLMSVFDSHNNLIDYQAWRYEIYKTANRTQRVLE